MDRPYLKSFAWLLGGICMAMAVLGLVLNASNGHRLLEDLLHLIIVLVISYAAVGTFIAWHRPRNAIGWIFVGAAFFQGLNIFTDQYAQYALVTHPDALPLGAEAIWLAQFSWMPGLALLLTFLPLLFPDGRPPSIRWWPVAWLGVLSVLMLIIPASILLWPLRGPLLMQPDFDPFLAPGSILLRVVNLSYPLLVFSSALALLALGWRFWHSQGAIRAQMKWFLLAAIVTFGGIVLLDALSGRNLQLDILLGLLGIFIIPTLPLVTAVAILRYRLYDIDVIIRKTLIYTILTALLALLFFGGVTVSQSLFVILTGQRSQIAVVASTLVIAALFTPLRQRIQAIIDRRFFRRKYDAQRVLAQFAATARDETDVDRLTAEVVQVVEETMQPAHVSVWLKHASADSQG